MKKPPSILRNTVVALLVGGIGFAAAPCGVRADDAASGKPTFARDVAPILQAHCQACHRAGEAAPMSLLTFEETRPWAKSIAQKVQAREMPPWHADPEVGKWSNDRRMSEKEIQTIVQWARLGAPMGNPEDLPPPLEFTEGWNIGIPDKIVYIAENPIIIPEDVEDQYRILLVNPKFEEDVWVEAVEVRPDNRAVVHHLLAMTIDPKDGIKKAQEGGGWLGSLAPGRQADEYGNGTARFIRAGSWVGFEVHYHKEKGIAATDRSMIGLRYAKEPVRKSLSNMRLYYEGIDIAPGDANHRLVFEEEFQQNVHFLTIMPHMHMRARTMRVSALYPNGGSETLLNVPNYDFNWQTTYYLEEPKAIPKGTRIRVEATYDNSENNPGNPDPTARVISGQETTDEMMVAFIDYTIDEEDLFAGEKLETMATLKISGGKVMDDGSVVPVPVPAPAK